MATSLAGIKWRASKLIRLSVSIMVLAFPFDVARAGDLCTDISFLMEQSQKDFVEVKGEAGVNGSSGVVTLTLNGAAACRVAKELSGDFYHCRWDFPHRAQEAYATFDDFVLSVGKCIGETADMLKDQNVNHPDYYALTRYEAEKASVTVSVKDKSALDRTFVFIRVEAK